MNFPNAIASGLARVGISIGKPVKDAKRGFTAKQGLWGERKAEEYLMREKKMKLLGRRVKISRDEIDLVMVTTDRRVPMVVFVEVKTRSSRLFGGGRGAVDRRKRHALCRAAVRYMQRMPEMPFRIDIVEVFGSCDVPIEPEIRHYERAVPMELRYAVVGLRHRH